VHFFRFEDLITEPKQVLLDVFKFLYGVDTVEGTYLEQRIDTVIKEGDRGH